MSTHRRHPLLRTAAVSTLVGGALLIPAAGAFAAAPSPEPTASQPSDKRGPVFEVTLGNGAKAKVQNRGGAYVATISVKGKETATLSATHSTTTQDGVRYELYPSNGHIGITYLKGEHERQATPKGGVKAGAEGVHGAGDPAFLVAGGGMAAAGAAGLGFAMLRRGRTDA
ncbi:hypothetical protein [Streptomyces formicae]